MFGKGPGSPDHAVISGMGVYDLSACPHRQVGGPFKMAGWYQPQIASCILVVWTLIIPLVIVTENKAS